MSEKQAKGQFIFAMLIFGTIGIFARYIAMPSAVIADARGWIGFLFLAALMWLRGRQMDWAAVRKNGKWLALSGAAIGLNWIFLFEAFRLTTVAVATLCYYLAPVFVTMASPFVLKEKLTGGRFLCVCAALGGMGAVSRFWEAGTGEAGMAGIFCGIAAAAFYAGVILCNKQFSPIPAYDMTIVQLFTAALVLLPYTLLTETVRVSAYPAESLAFLFLVGAVHTGFTYALYFGAMPCLRGQTIAIFSYIDPVTAILLSAFFLGEPMGFWEILGAVLILGGALASEMLDRR